MREKKEVNIQIGERIKQAREQAKMTQEQLAERVAVSPQYVSDLERGVVGISIPTLKRVCTVLHVSSDQLLFDQKAESHLSGIVDKCKGLSPKQLYLLLEIIERYVEAVEDF